jgi:hypothetical protein
MAWVYLMIGFKGLLILIYSWHQKFKFCIHNFVQGICNVVHVWGMWILVDVGAPSVASFFLWNHLLSWGFNLWCFWEVGVIFVNIFLFWDLTRNNLAWLLGVNIFLFWDLTRLLGVNIILCGRSWWFVIGNLEWSNPFYANRFLI